MYIKPLFKELKMEDGRFFMLKPEVVITDTTLWWDSRRWMSSLCSFSWVLKSHTLSRPLVQCIIRMYLLMLAVICLERSGNWLQWSGVGVGCTCQVAVFLNHISRFAGPCEDHSPLARRRLSAHCDKWHTGKHTHVSRLWTIPPFDRIICAVCGAAHLCVFILC